MTREVPTWMNHARPTDMMKTEEMAPEKMKHFKAMIDQKDRQFLQEKIARKDGQVDVLKQELVRVKKKTLALTEHIQKMGGTAPDDPA